MVFFTLINSNEEKLINLKGFRAHMVIQMYGKTN